jgi:hypothetical protein
VLLTIGLAPFEVQPLVSPYSASPLPARLTGEATQAAALQNPLQLASVVQLVRQAVPPALHWYALHDVCVPPPQVPAPSQVEAVLAVPLAQPAAWQTVPAAYLRQAPAPSHRPSLPQLETGSASQSLCGSVPAAADVHCPSLPTPAQVWQVPLHAVWQQTPSTQKPLMQAALLVQAVPFGSAATQVPAEQKWPVAQSLFCEQDVWQAVAPHMYAPHESLVAL